MSIYIGEVGFCNVYILREIGTNIIAKNMTNLFCSRTKTKDDDSHIFPWKRIIKLLKTMSTFRQLCILEATRTYSNTNAPKIQMHWQKISWKIGTLRMFMLCHTETFCQGAKKEIHSGYVLSLVIKVEILSLGRQMCARVFKYLVIDLNHTSLNTNERTMHLLLSFNCRYVHT